MSLTKDHPLSAAPPACGGPERLAVHLASSRSSDFQRPRPARSCAQPMQAPPRYDLPPWDAPQSEHSIFFSAGCLVWMDLRGLMKPLATLSYSGMCTVATSRYVTVLVVAGEDGRRRVEIERRRMRLRDEHLL